MTVTTQLQQSPYLRLQRQFPYDNLAQLAQQLDQAYIDIAIKVNTRSIGVYAVDFPIITGDSWFFQGQPLRQQSLKQVYTFTASGAINHGINPDSVSKFSPKSYGSYTDGTNWYGVIYGSSVAITGQVSFYITPTQIIVLSGAGAPAISSGIITLDWISVF